MTIAVGSGNGVVVFTIFIVITVFIIIVRPIPQGRLDIVASALAVP